MVGDVSYTLIRHKRKTLQLRVEADGSLIVKAPLRLAKREIEAFIARKADWIETRRAAYLARPVRSLCDGEALKLCIGSLTIATGRPRLALDEGRIYLPEGERAVRLAALEKLLRQFARTVFTERIAHYAPLVGVKPGCLRISGAKTRWGSCGKDDSINLNWRLVLALPELVDYVVVHELSHILERNHSAAFWAQVGRILPDYAARRRTLNTHQEEFTI